MDVLLENEDDLVKIDNPCESTSKVVMEAIVRAVRMDDDTGGMVSIGYLTPKLGFVEKYDSRNGYKKVSDKTYNNLKRKENPGN